MFAAIKSLIPEPRQATQPRHYVGRHRQTEPTPVPVPQDAPVSPAPVVTEPVSPVVTEPVSPVVTKPAEKAGTAAA
jgi:hypothetical protein